MSLPPMLLTPAAESAKPSLVLVFLALLELDALEDEDFVLLRLLLLDDVDERSADTKSDESG